MSIYIASKIIPSTRFTTYLKPWERQGQILDVGSGWESGSIVSCSLLKDGSTYKLWYAGYQSNYQIGYATSGDCITWTRSGSNPVITIGSAGQFDDTHATHPNVIKEGPTDYKIWYTGVEGSEWTIGYATSGDGITWTKYGSNPILEKGSGGAFDDGYVSHPCVIKDGLIYKMWYTASDGAVGRTGYATSGDGFTWTKYAGNPVLDVGGGQWDSLYAYLANIIKDSIYRMWYSGNSGSGWKIGYATSMDGITWSKHGLVIDKEGSGWEDTNVEQPCCIKDGIYYKLIYAGSGSNNSLGLVTTI